MSKSKIPHDRPETGPAEVTVAGQEKVEPGIPKSKRQLRAWIKAHFDVKLADEPVCFGHCAPWTIFTDLYFQRPSVALVLGPRGGGKSFLSALHTHLVSRRDARHETRILGGSLAQSEQVYRALAEVSGHGWGVGCPRRCGDREAVEGTGRCIRTGRRSRSWRRRAPVCAGRMCRA